MKKSNKQLGRLIIDFGKRIEDGTCGADIETIESVARMIMHVKKNHSQLEDYLGCSRATIDRMVADGRLPRPYKEQGGKEFWYLDEVEEHIAKYNEMIGK